MAEHLPAPSARLRDFVPRDSEVFVLHAGVTVWRLYCREPHGTTWSTFRDTGPIPSTRFDHHLEDRTSPRSILYAADDPTTCLVEVFQETRVIDPFTNAPCLAEFAFHADLRLLDVAGPWITRAGGSMAINSGVRDTARDWSRAIYDAFPDIHGLRYASSTHANRPCYAIYERAAPLLARGRAFDEPLSHPELEPLLSHAVYTLGYELE